ncbi:hypothetical protein N7532_010209 [Penicillium argentinense]|uniref:Alcohol dehydrogenase iron-type/glycerol dehydrogenase GldA domain-containing protein n=1 Tax=Penicillium argentinense TaxID=1131581 RepID=A0A9W9JXQ2_9EURO|nr:uncharacterized protein N7532_010209 [Penicillium argentinense]KAJ5085438.1 hypothetical protein N7532_010209 [Penicillium argentinense]
MSETVRPAFAGRERPLLSYGIAFPAAAANHVTVTFHASRVYMICSGSLARNTDSLDRLIAALGPEKVVGHRVGMQSHTLWSEVLEIVDEARNAKADLILTLGAGSLTDGAKIVALALANDIHTQDELETLAQGPSKRAEINAPTVPIISVPTSLSAGEYSNFAGGTKDSSRRKYSFQPPTRGPQLIILDPELAEATPDSIWISTGVRAVDHCVETLCAIVGTTSASDELAEHALGLLVPGLLRCKKDRSDRDAHLQCQLGSVDAMAASVCKFNAKYNANCDRQARVREFLLNDPVVSDVLHIRSVDIETADLGDILDAVIRELGMPRSLGDVHVGRDKLDALAAHSLHDRWCQSNPVPLKEKEQVLEILEMVV